MTATAALLVDYPVPAAELSRSGRRLALGLTFAVHLLLFAFLFFGVRWTTQVNEAVEVELVRAAPQPAVAPAPPALKKVPERPLEPALPPQPVSKPPSPLPRPDIALKEDQKEKPKPPAAVPAPPQVDPLQKQIEQELRRTQLERQKVEAASALDQELAELQNKKQAMEQARLASSKAMADYVSRIRGRIKGNIVLPPDIKGNPEAVFEVIQFPSGEILDVRLKKSSGHAAYDVAVERAIRKSSPLPKPERGDLFARNLELRFHPLED
ncbi:MAG: TonB family protein [Sterolibacterium sp.]|nr:TonB family protein [Sterolibacterium sp.]